MELLKCQGIFAKTSCFSEKFSGEKGPVEQETVCSGALRHPLRVPLHAPHRQRPVPEGFHRAVIRPLQGLQPMSQPPHDLVMAAVDGATVVVQCLQRRGDRGDGVEPVRAVYGAVAGPVLDQVAAEKHVDALHPTAHPQDRLFPGDEMGQQFPFQGVPGRVQPPAGRIFLAVAPGLQIPAAGQQETAAGLRRAMEAGDAACTPDGGPIVAVGSGIAGNTDPHSQAPFCPEKPDTLFYAPGPRFFLAMRAILWHNSIGTGDVPKWLKGPDSKSGRRRKACGGSNPSISAKLDKSCV